MIDLQKHECLSVNLLVLEVVHVVRSAREVLDEVTDLLNGPLPGVVLEQLIGGAKLLRLGRWRLLLLLLLLLMLNDWWGRCRLNDIVNEFAFLGRWAHGRDVLVFPWKRNARDGQVNFKSTREVGRTKRLMITLNKKRTIVLTILTVELLLVRVVVLVGAADGSAWASLCRYCGRRR